MNLSSLFRPSSGDRRKKPLSPGQMEHDSPHGSPQQQQKRQQEKRRWRSSRKSRTPKLERTNASSYIDYEPPRASSDSHSYYDSPNSRSGGTATPRTRSLDLPQTSSGSHRDKTSFRIHGGGESEIQELCSSLGITGPEDFAVPVDDWNARRLRCSSEVLPRSAPFESVAEVPTRAALLMGEALASTARSPSPSPSPSPSCCSPSHDAAAAVPVSSSSRKAGDEDVQQQTAPSPESRSWSTAAHAGTVATSTSRLVPNSQRVNGGIRGVRPPILAPPSPCCSPSHIAAAVPVSRRSRNADEEGRQSDGRLSPELRRPDDSQGLQSFGIRPCSPATVDAETAATSTSSFVSSTERVNRGIRGVRPPILTPPPSMSRPTALGSTVSPWELLRSFAPQHGEPDGQVDFPLHEQGGAFPYSDDDEGTLLQENGARPPDEAGEFTEEVAVPGLVNQPSDEITTAFNSFTTGDDDSSSTTTEGAYGISPNGRFRRNIRGWSIGRELGRGSFGIVYEAISEDGFFFAVKEVSLLDEGEAQQSIVQLEQEIALLSQFEHENIVQYLGTETAENKLYIFLELVTQGSLASLYHKYHLRDSQVSAYTRQILQGLKYLHDQNVVHRDIKCANILVDANGSVKLADFGLAKQTKKADMKSCRGSVYWMAPEVVNPIKEYGWPADIWSLGCTVLEMLTQNPPYNVEWARAFFMIGRGELPDIPESLSSDARDFIQKCLQVDPDHRPDASSLLQHPFVRRQAPSWGNEYSHCRRT